MQEWRIIVHGKVQGVAFRAFVNCIVQERASSLAGYVKNLSDGGVEILAQGKKDDLEELLRHCRQGPRRAFVRSVDVEKRDLLHAPGEARYHGFTVKY